MAQPKGRRWSYRNFELFFISDVKEKADKVLEEWDDICKEANIEHFLLLGTCLGFVRDKGYIKGDHDLDVGVRGEEDFLTLSKKLLENGFTVVDRFSLPLGKGTHFSKDSIWLDVFFDLGPYKKFGWLKSFDKVRYNDRIYNIPHPIETYLKQMYGDWKTPRLPRPQDFPSYHIAT